MRGSAGPNRSLLASLSSVGEWGGSSAARDFQVRCLHFCRLDFPQARATVFPCEAKLSPAQIVKARRLIDHGERVEDVAALYNVGRTTLYRALAE